MSRLHPITLVTENDKLAPRGSVIAGGSRRLIQPAYPFDWSQFSEVRIELFIRQINGSPTAWSLKPRLEVGVTTTFGYQFTNPWWQQLTPERASELCAGSWLPDIDQTVSLPQSFGVTIIHPPAAMRINLGESGPNALTFTGGTAPNVQAALVAYGKA